MSTGAELLAQSREFLTSTTSAMSPEAWRAVSVVLAALNDAENARDDNAKLANLARQFSAAWWQDDSDELLLAAREILRTVASAGG